MKIDLNAENALSPRSSLIYGVYGSGKTHFCATYPKVVWFGSAREGGYETIRYMDPAHWYDPNVPPALFVVESAAEMMQHLSNDVMPRVLKGQYQTIVLELSFYADDMVRKRADEGTWQRFADLEKHIVFLDEAWKKVPNLRIVYNALAATEEDPKKPSSILISGKAVARKLPASCDLIGYLRAEQVENGTERVLHLSPYGNFPARHRYGNRLPAIVREPTFRKLEGLLKGKLVADVDGNVTDAPVRVVGKGG